MRRTILFMAALAILFCPIASAQTRVSAGISIGDQGPGGFYMAIGNYYHVPERQVMVMRDRSISDDELPVVFFLAQRARVRPEMIVDLRLSGMSWNDVTTHFGLGPDIYYYSPGRNYRGGSPYGQAYGHFRDTRRNQWRRMQLSDEDIVNLVNLRFVAEHGGMRATQVMQMREGGHPFTTIYSNTRRGHAYNTDAVRRGRGPGNYGNGQGQGQDQGQGRGRGR